MPRFVVLLKGVNVGKGNRIPMAEFREALEELGYEDVSTLLNSGNAVFTSDGSSSLRAIRNHEQRISEAIAEKFSLHVPVAVRSASQWEQIIQEMPFAIKQLDSSKLLVAVPLTDTALNTLRTLTPLPTSPDQLAFSALAGYLYCPDGISRSRTAESLLGKAGQLVTTRNWNTSLRIQHLLSRD